MEQPVLPEEIGQKETEGSHIQTEENASSLDRSMDHRHRFRLYQDHRQPRRQHRHEGQKDKCRHRSSKADVLRQEKEANGITVSASAT